MRYARSDVLGWNPSSAACAGHSKTAGNTVTHPAAGVECMVIDCPTCERELENDPLWAAEIEHIPLTASQQKAIDDGTRHADKLAASWASALATAATVQRGLRT